ncbi:MAG: hypothetical protein LJE64_07455 [Desulfofustis sp.]|jgi:hypothetical protein|nr:hypothetical protein [Desulfofustis sp.]
MSQDKKFGPSPEQILYANILNKGMLIGLGVLLVTFSLYVFGIMDPYIPFDKLTISWSQPVSDYLHELNIPTGWAWLGMLGYGDFINFIGIAFLAGVSIICYLAIIPTLLKSGDKIYAVIAILEVIVLTAAATGIFGSGGH